MLKTVINHDSLKSGNGLLKAVPDAVFMERRYTETYNRLSINCSLLNTKVLPFLEELGCLDLSHIFEYAEVKNLETLREKFIQERKERGFAPCESERLYNDVANKHYCTYYNERKDGSVILPTLYINAISSVYQDFVSLEQNEENKPYLKIDEKRLELSFMHKLTDKERAIFEHAKALIDLLNGDCKKFTRNAHVRFVCYDGNDGKWKINGQHIIDALIKNEF